MVARFGHWSPSAQNCPQPSIFWVISASPMSIIGSYREAVPLGSFTREHRYRPVVDRAIRSEMEDETRSPTGMWGCGIELGFLLFVVANWSLVGMGPVSSLCVGAWCGGIAP